MQRLNTLDAPPRIMTFGAKYWLLASRFYEMSIPGPTIWEGKGVGFQSNNPLVTIAVVWCVFCRIIKTIPW